MQHLIIASTVSALFLFSACGSNEQNQDAVPKTDTHMEQGTMQSDQSTEMKSDKSWVRTEPIDVKAIDVNGDGYVWQDHMDWNVIADEEGKCPECGMYLKKTTIADAEKNLRDHNMKMK